MKYPEFLNDNGVISLVAPSFGCNMEPYKSRLESAVSYFKDRGYIIDIGPNAFLGEGIGISNTPKNCGDELTTYYMNNGDILISVGGGELMCETLDYVDFDKLKMGKPKWFMGYSDNTHFGFLLPTILDTASIYGPNAPDFGVKPMHESLRDSLNILRGKSTISHGYSSWEMDRGEIDSDPLKGYTLSEKTEVRFVNYNEKPISGRFIGGCLDVLMNICGTKYDRVKDFNEKYKDDGIIWFMEACEYNPTGIRRSLWHLKNSGWFKYVKAFVFGRPMCIKDVDFLGLDEYKAVESMLREYNVPIILDTDIGHLKPSMPIINGGYGTLRKYEDNIGIEWDFKR